MGRIFEILSVRTTRFCASTAGFATALIIVLVWLACGPFLGFSDTWQGVINTAATITTFLMVFLLQRAQAKDVSALHLKLNELIASQVGASNRLLNVEERTEEELAELRRLHGELPKDTISSHSLAKLLNKSATESIAPGTLNKDQ